MLVNKISTLIVLLLIQCGLIVWLYSGNLSSNNEQKSDQVLIKLDTNKIDSITIKDEKNKTLTLKKTDNGWMLPDYHQLAVDQGLLEQLFEKLIAIQTDWPVASSPGAAERFQVSQDKFKRHITFNTTDESTSELYLGDSPGLRKIYARNAKDSNIYVVELGLYLASSEAERWFDKRLLKVRKGIDTIQGVDFIVTSQADNWRLKDQQENESIDQTRLDKLINALEYPQVNAVADADKVNQLKDKKADTHYTIQVGADEISYDYYRLNDDVILKSSLSELYFIVPIYVTENLLGINRDGLLKKDKKNSVTENKQAP